MIMQQTAEGVPIEEGVVSEADAVHPRNFKTKIGDYHNLFQSY